MVTMAALESWQPKRLNGVADDLRRRESAAKELQDELNGGRPPEGWQDDFNSDRARQKHRGLRDRMNDIAASISLLIAELEVAADHLAAAKRMVESWKERATGCGYTLSEVARMVDGVKVPPDEEVAAVAANSDLLLWADQHERLSAFRSRAQDLIDNVQACLDPPDERGLLLGVADMDDFIEELDRDDGLLGLSQTVRLRRAVAQSRDKLASALSERSSTGHVIARRWATEDDA